MWVVQARMFEEFQNELSQQLAEQERELQNAFAMEKQDLLEQYESRRNLTEIQHQQEIKELDRLHSWWVAVKKAHLRSMSHTKTHQDTYL